MKRRCPILLRLAVAREISGTTPGLRPSRSYFFSGNIVPGRILWAVLRILIGTYGIALIIFPIIIKYTALAGIRR